MTQACDDETSIGQHFALSSLKTTKELTSPDQTQAAIDSAIKQANIQTGTRDLTSLMMTSLFSILLIFFAPMAGIIAKKTLEKKHE